MGCIPIVKRSPFIDTLVHYSGGEIVMIVIESWNHIHDIDFLPYKLNNVPKWANLDYYNNEIDKKDL